jgi:hypothetical protein
VPGLLVLVQDARGGGRVIASEAHNAREARIALVLAEAENDLAAWLLAQQLGESEEVVNRIGFVMYDKLAKAFGIGHDGDAAFAIAAALLSTGAPKDTATRMRVGLQAFMSGASS